MASESNPDIAERVRLAAEAYFYGYPLVYSMHEIAKFPTGSNLVGKPISYNQFGHGRYLADPDIHFVSPNNDTLYTVAVCDLRNGPLVLHTPDTHGRYYVLQFVDMWSNNFAYIGRRPTGTDEARFVLAAHDYAGELPADLPVVHSPTGVFAIVGRVAVNGAADLPAAHALQDQFSLTPLSVYQGSAAPAPAQGLPPADARVGDDLKFWEEFRVALAAFPPPAADAPFLEICGALGLLDAESPYVSPDPILAKVLMAGQKAGQDKIEELIQTTSKTANGWQNTKNLFNYNTDFFEIGTINAPEWKIADRKTAVVTRAVVARAGFWGNHGYEATYQVIYVDADDKPLSSEHRYELRLPSVPPVDAFWSLTMYGVPEFYLVHNVLNRYSIGSHTPGLNYAADGSLTLYLQKDPPGPDKEANWLPTPQSGPFRPIMRLYQPRQPILDDSYLLPAVVRVD